MSAYDWPWPGNFYDWQARATAFESMAAFAYTERIFTWNDQAERVLGVLSAGSVFDVLGRGAAGGRTFTAQEDKPGGEAFVVLSHALARRISGEQSAVGRSIGIGGVAFTVIGVMPPDFTFPDYDAQYWIPARFDAQFRGNRDQYFLRAVARLRSGLSVEQARAQLDTVMEVTATDPATFATVSVLLVSIAALASYLPARRATRVDPVTVLRQE